MEKSPYIGMTITDGYNLGVITICFSYTHTYTNRIYGVLDPSNKILYNVTIWLKNGQKLSKYGNPTSNGILSMYVHK